MNTFMTTQFLYTTDAWIFHNQEPNQYINLKILLRILNKDHESSFNEIPTIKHLF